MPPWLPVVGVSRLTKHVAVDTRAFRIDAGRAPAIWRIGCFARDVEREESTMRHVLRLSPVVLIASIGLAISACNRPAAEPEAPPSALAERQPTALICKAPQRLCPTCNGGQICALRCPECAPQVTAEPEALPSTLAERQPTALTCRAPQRLCTSCSGGQICAIQCPACPPPASAEPGDLPEALAIGPASAEFCGGRICPAGTSCCNPSCGICTPKGVNCTQQSCN
jgi:hypothetical protein